MKQSIFNNKNLSTKEIISEFYKQFNNEIPDNKSIVTNFYFDALKSKNINNLLALQELNILPQNSNITTYDFIWDVIKLDNYKDFFSLYNDLGIFNEEYINRDLERTNCIISSLIFKNKTDVLNNLLDAGFPHKLFSNSAYVYYILNNKNEIAAKQLFDKNIEIPFSLMISAFMWSSSNNKNIQKHYNVIEMFLDNVNKNEEIDKSKFNQLKTMAYLNLLDSEHLQEDFLNKFLNKYKPGVYDPFYFEFMNKEMGLSKKIAESELHLHYFLKNDISNFSKNYLKELSYSIAYHALRKDSEETIYYKLENSFDFNFKNFINSEKSESQSLIEYSFINYNNETYKLLIENGLSIDYSKKESLLSQAFKYFSNMYRYNNGKQIAKAQEAFIIDYIIGDTAFDINSPIINVEITDKHKFFSINFLQMALEIKSKKILNSLKSQERFNLVTSVSEYVFSKMYEYKLKENLDPEDISLELAAKLNIIFKTFNTDIKDVVLNSISDIFSQQMSKDDFTELLQIEIDRKNLKNLLNSACKKKSVSFKKGRL